VRNWWFEMIRSRDGIDPQATMNHLDTNGANPNAQIATYLPGSRRPGRSAHPAH